MDSAVSSGGAARPAPSPRGRWRRNPGSRAAAAGARDLPASTDDGEPSDVAHACRPQLQQRQRQQQQDRKADAAARVATSLGRQCQRRGAGGGSQHGVGHHQRPAGSPRRATSQDDETGRREVAEDVKRSGGRRAAGQTAWWIAPFTAARKRKQATRREPTAADSATDKVPLYPARCTELVGQGQRREEQGERQQCQQPHAGGESSHLAGTHPQSDAAAAIPRARTGAASPSTLTTPAVGPTLLPAGAQRLTGTTAVSWTTVVGCKRNAFQTRTRLAPRVYRAATATLEPSRWGACTASSDFTPEEEIEADIHVKNTFLHVTERTFGAIATRRTSSVLASARLSAASWGRGEPMGSPSGACTEAAAAATSSLAGATPPLAGHQATEELIATKLAGAEVAQTAAASHPRSDGGVSDRLAELANPVDFDQLFEPVEERGVMVQNNACIVAGPSITAPAERGASPVHDSAAASSPLATDGEKSVLVLAETSMPVRCDRTDPRSAAATSSSARPAHLPVGEARGGLAANGKRGGGGATDACETFHIGTDDSCDGHSSSEISGQDEECDDIPTALHDLAATLRDRAESIDKLLCGETAPIPVVAKHEMAAAPSPASVKHRRKRLDKWFADFEASIFGMAFGVKAATAQLWFLGFLDAAVSWAPEQLADSPLEGLACLIAAADIEWAGPLQPEEFVKNTPAGARQCSPEPRAPHPRPRARGGAERHGADGGEGW